MPSIKHNRYECALCGKPRVIEDQWTCKSYCDECWPIIYDEEIHQMRARDGVFYKYYMLTRAIANNGRPKIWRPSPGTTFRFFKRQLSKNDLTVTVDDTVVPFPQDRTRKD